MGNESQFVWLCKYCTVNKTRFCMSQVKSVVFAVVYVFILYFTIMEMDGAAELLMGHFPLIFRDAQFEPCCIKSKNIEQTCMSYIVHCA